MCLRHLGLPTPRKSCRFSPRLLCPFDNRPTRLDGQCEALRWSQAHKEIKGLWFTPTRDGVVLVQRETGSRRPRVGCKTHETINSALEKVSSEACPVASVVAG